jgi:hypothetical protein
VELSAVAIVLHVNHAKSSMNFTRPNGFVKICSSVLVEAELDTMLAYLAHRHVGVRLGHVLEAELMYVLGGGIYGEAQYMSLSLLCSCSLVQIKERVLLFTHKRNGTVVVPV